MKNSLNLRLALAGMHARATVLHGVTAHRGNLEGLAASFEQAINRGIEEAAAHEKKMGELMDRARSKDPEAATELNALRSQTIDLYVRATSNFAQMFYREVPLQPNEQACFIHTFRNQVGVRYVGQDGGPRQVKAVKAQKQVFIDMRELETSEVGYQIRDVNLGTDVAAAAQATVDLGFDMANKVDVDAKTLLDTLYGNFVTTGAKLNRTWIPNDRIVEANLPLTNDLVLPDNGTGTNQSNKFRLSVIRAIMRYCDQWGQVFGTPLAPTGAILVPSIDVTDLAEEIQPTSLIFPNALAEQLLQNYKQFKYMGILWTLIPDVTLAQGTCYPVLNRPVGEMYTKTSMDEEIVETNRRKNWETRVQKKVVNFATPEPWRVNTVRVKYHA